MCSVEVEYVKGNVMLKIRMRELITVWQYMVSIERKRLLLDDLVEGKVRCLIVEMICVVTLLLVN